MKKNSYIRGIDVLDDHIFCIIIVSYEPFLYVVSTSQALEHAAIPTDRPCDRIPIDSIAFFTASLSISKTPPRGDGTVSNVFILRSTCKRADGAMVLFVFFRGPRDYTQRYGMDEEVFIMKEYLFYSNRGEHAVSQTPPRLILQYSVSPTRREYSTHSQDRGTCVDVRIALSGQLLVNVRDDRKSMIFSTSIAQLKSTLR